MTFDPLEKLIGPFSMGDVPQRAGFYCITVHDTTEMWYWTGQSWADNDDGLGGEKDPSEASGWYGRGDENV